MRDKNGAVAIMQPYVFPYIGYFHLLSAVDFFVFYDDVPYMKKGWVNRNRVLIEGRAHTFTVPLRSASQNKLICELAPVVSSAWINSFYKMLFHGYTKSPFFRQAIDPIMSVFSRRYANAADLAIESIRAVYDYLELDIRGMKSSLLSPETQRLKGADRLISITQLLGSSNYVNAPGGRLLYSKSYFNANSVKLSFVDSEVIQYPQFSERFVESLSIIDVLMFNSPSRVREFFEDFRIA